jgi:hypothetical protein
MGFKILEWDDAIEYLTLAYRRGVLVPFIGSGLSAPAVPTWPDFIRRLADDSGQSLTFSSEHPSAQELVLMSERLVSKPPIRGEQFSVAVERALKCPDGDPPCCTPATKLLASVWWPLVLSTNYERMFLKEFNTRYSLKGLPRSESMIVLGRNRKDCQTLLASLNVPMNPILWALQGFLGQSENEADLRNEIVVGYDQYREVTFNDLGFRAAFSEVFRNRSLLFIGAGLGEEYFRGLFGESLVRLGPSQHAHCALVNRRDVPAVDPWFLHTKLNIVVLTYEDPDKEKPYSGFAPCLEKLSQILVAPPSTTERVFISTARASLATIELLPAPLPVPTEDHWVVVSAGREPGSEQLLPSHDVPIKVAKPFRQISGTKWVWRVDGQPWLLLAAARNVTLAPTSGESRDLRAVSEATEEALRVATESGCTSVSMMLLAAGGNRRWPRVFSLVQMLRGIRRFLSHPETHSLRVRILVHDTAVSKDPSAWAAVQSRRLDPNEILGCEALRFFVELDDGRVIRRTPMYVTEEEQMSDLADYFQVAVEGWEALIHPSPFFDQQPASTTATRTLRDLGIVPGSTIRFRRASTPGALTS